MLTFLLNDTFTYLTALEYLVLSDNQIETIDLNAFIGLKSLYHLNISNNKLKYLQINNQSLFRHLNNLQDLILNSNLIEYIKWNDFSGLTRLVYLNLDFNKIKAIEPKSFETNNLTEFLFLASNSLRTIESNTFYGLNKIEEISLENNYIIDIKSNSFNNSHPKFVFLSIKNITNELIFNLIDSFKFSVIKSFANIQYYDSIFIENRDDIDCNRTFIFLKHKIFYNFLKEYDMIQFLNDCRDKSSLKDALEKLKS